MIRWIQLYGMSTMILINDSFCQWYLLVQVHNFNNLSCKRENSVYKHFYLFLKSYAAGVNFGTIRRRTYLLTIQCRVASLTLLLRISLCSQSYTMEWTILPCNSYWFWGALNKKNRYCNGCSNGFEFYLN